MCLKKIIIYMKFDPKPWAITHSTTLTENQSLYRLVAITVEDQEAVGDVVNIEVSTLFKFQQFLFL